MLIYTKSLLQVSLLLLEMGDSMEILFILAWFSWIFGLIFATILSYALFESSVHEPLNMKPEII